MTRLKTQQTAKDGSERLKEKLTVVRHLYLKNFSKQDVLNFFRELQQIYEKTER